MSGVRRTMPFAEMEQNVPSNEQKSRKKKRHQSTGSMRESTEQQDTHWRQLFYNLQQERVTAAEESLGRVLQESEKREEALKNYIRHLESDLIAARQGVDVAQRNAEGMVELQEEFSALRQEYEEKKKQCHDLETASAAMAETHTAEKLALQENIHSQQTHLKLYQNLTGASVVSCTHNSVTWSIQNGTASTEFSLRKLDEEMTEYEPSSTGASSKLPKFLHQAIEYETQDTPSLLHNVLQGMYPDEED